MDLALSNLQSLMCDKNQPTNIKTVSLYHNSSVWVDLWYASIWDQNPADFTPVGSSLSACVGTFFTYDFFYIYVICYLEYSVLKKSYYISAYLAASKFPF